jgi:ABC-2 type transport system ATP-binding protein
MIEIETLQFGYGRKRPPLFERLDLRVGTGTICGVLGSNGAGKSTLLRLLAGLSFPHSGRCRVLGHSPRDREPAFLSEIFLLPEEVFVPALTAAAHVGQIGPLYPAWDQAVFDSLMKDFGLPVDKRLTGFSHGQKKKFLLAVGLATGARLLILDEPTNGIDINGKQDFRRALLNHYSPQRSFLISTHQVHDLQGLIDAVMILADGKLLLHESLERLGSHLQVETSRERPTDALFVAETLDGFRALRRNESGEEGSIDLELLFGCVTSQPQRVQALLSLGEVA